MTTEGQDNPWAFPLAEGAGADGRRGMSLRDYFAAAALQGMLGYDTGDATINDVCNKAYTYADVMLKARKEGV